MNPVPLLAEGYERSADGLTYTVRLKKGVQFHDGTEFDAEAVKLNFDRVLRPNSGLTRRAIYTFIDTVKGSSINTRYSSRSSIRTAASSGV